MTQFNPRAFVGALLAAASEGCDIDPGDLHEMLLAYGLCEERPLTAEEIADEDGPWHEHGCREGDLWTFRTAALQAWLTGDPPAEKAKE